jgi:YcxB-like protein
LRLALARMRVSDGGPLLGPTTATIEDDGLRIDRRCVRSKYLWPAFQAVEVTKTALILVVDNGIGLIIPGAVFTSEAERYAFAAAIQKRLELAKAENPRD